MYTARASQSPGTRNYDGQTPLHRAATTSYGEPQSTARGGPVTAIGLAVNLLGRPGTWLCGKRWSPR